MLLTETVERFYSKPRGYAGDYQSIRMLYESKGRGTSRLGPPTDVMFDSGNTTIRFFRAPVGKSFLVSRLGLLPQPSHDC